jgi:hypothetical protein
VEQGAATTGGAEDSERELGKMIRREEWRNIVMSIRRRRGSSNSRPTRGGGAMQAIAVRYSRNSSCVRYEIVLCVQSPPRRPVLRGRDGHTVARRSREEI